MITEEIETDKMCLFCASDYHLEMILLPYIKERLNNSNFIIFTESDLTKSLDVLLSKINLDDETKNRIRCLDWTNEDKFEELQKNMNINKELSIIINGETKYINEVNKKIKSVDGKSVNIIDCFHVGDFDVNIEEISKKYRYVLNTQKI